MVTEPALLKRRAIALLPNGTRLVARLQSTVSTAVKTPVVAAIEYNYERDGEIIIPRGRMLLGISNRRIGTATSGSVSIRLRCPMERPRKSMPDR
jgi:hypothetical protein